MAKYLDYDGVLYFWQKCKAKFALITHTHTKNQITDFPTIPSKTSDLTNDSGYITSADVPEGAAASATTPLMDGTAAVGSETAFARGDHRHPSDTSKVDKVSGKGLSTNDYTTAEKNKLSGIATGAEVNVQSDWNETDTTSDAFIKNKPTIPSAWSGEKVYYGTCDTDPSITTKVVICPEFVLEQGAVINFFVTSSHVSGTPKFDVNGTGAKYAYRENSLTLNGFNGGELLTLVYDGTFYRVASHTHASTLTFGMTKLSTAIDGTEDYLAATPSAVKQAYDLAASKASTDVATSSANGLMPSTDKAKLDSLTITNGIIDASNLPSFVDDVIEAYPRSGQTELSSTWLATGSASGTVITPETGKIYVLMADSTSYATNTQFRWGGSAYVKLADGGVSAITNAEIDTICV